MTGHPCTRLRALALPFALLALPAAAREFDCVIDPRQVVEVRSPVEGVIEEKDVDHSIYEVPLMLQRDRVDDLVCSLLKLDTPPANMDHWQEITRKLIAPQHRVRIGVVGKYIELQDAYKSVYEAIIHGGIAND